MGWGDRERAEYNKSVNRNKASQRDWNNQRGNNKSKNSGGPGIGCLGLSVVIAGVLLLVLFGLFIKIAEVGFATVSNIETAESFGVGQYLYNVIHLDRSALFEIGPEPLACYDVEFNLKEIEAIKPIMMLESGQKFIYRGYKIINDTTCVAVQLWQRGNPLFCYIIIPQHWKGKSFWGHDPIVAVFQVDMEPHLINARKELFNRVANEVEIKSIIRNEANDYFDSKEYKYVSKIISPQTGNYLTRPDREIYHFVAKQNFKHVEEIEEIVMEEERIWKSLAQID